MLRRLAVPAIAVLALACGDDGSPSVADTETGAETTGDATTSGSSSSSSTQDPGTSSSDSDAESSTSGVYDPPEAVCGNGYVEGDEHCDDANDDNDDECTNACQIRCGLDWSGTVSPPTGESLIDPRAVARDADDNVIVVGFLREVTTDQKGNETAADDEVIAIKLDGAGVEVWRREIGEATGDLVVAGLAVDDAGDLFVSATGDGPNGDDDIFVYKLAGADGELLWTHAHDSAVDNAEDEAFGIAVGGDGHPVVSGQVRVAEGDDDIFVRKLDGDTGEPLWSETWSGVGNALYSSDNGGPVAVHDDGTVYVLGQEYVDFQILYVVLLRFATDGGAPESIYTPMIEGGTQEYAPLDVGVDGESNVVLTFRRLSGVVNTFVVQKLDAMQNVLWTMDHEAFAREGGEDWSIVGADPSPTGEVVVAGQVTVEGDGAEWFETWIARLDADGMPICQVQQRGPQASLLPSSLRPRAVASASNGAPLLGAQVTEEGGQSIWIGRFLVN